MSDKLTTFNPGVRRSSAPFVPPLAPTKKRFYVFDNDAKSIGGVKVQSDDGDRFVVMTEAEAQYYVDQGHLGDKPKDKLSQKAQTAIAQSIGDEEGAKATGRKHK